MRLDEMSDILKTSLGLNDNPVGVALFRREEDIPKELAVIERPLRYCEMIQGARLSGNSYMATVDKHECKGGAAGIGLMECPENIASGALYFSKLNKCVSKGVGARISADMPRPPAGSIIATYVAPLDKMVVNPDVVVLVGIPLVARRITQAVMYMKGGRAEYTTAGIQTFCVDATASPYLKGEVNVSLGCDGSQRNSGLRESEMVMGVPFEMLEGICTVLRDHYKGWDAFMAGK
ncbi:MAG TPA: DUF169 domain-containing protein [Methanotrichaceae archaeon]|nr:DUF169 domain-containing protein [Methanotrichaceae archaeon]